MELSSWRHRVGLGSALALCAALLIATSPGEARAQWEEEEEESPPVHHVRSKRMSLGGITLAVAGSLVMAIGEGMIADGIRGNHPGFLGGIGEVLGGLELLPMGGSAILTGIPLAMVGASEREPRYPAMAASGIALTTVGAGALGVGATLLVIDPRQTRVSGGWASFVGGAAGIVGGLVLWRVGDARRDGPAQPAAIPGVVLGPGKGEVTWAF